MTTLFRVAHSPELVLVGKCQFLGQMSKPDVDSVDGLSPSISIDQKTTSNNPRSTVGTVTEIYDYLRLLYARIGVPHCPICGKEISQQTTDQIVDVVMKLDVGTRFQILAPVVKGRKGEHTKELEAARKSGYSRVRIDGNIYDLSEEIKLKSRGARPAPPFRHGGRSSKRRRLTEQGSARSRNEQGHTLRLRC